MSDNVIEFKRFGLKLRGDKTKDAPTANPFKLTEVEVYNGKIYECKLSGNNFRGPCPIHACHANLDENMHPSRCIYLFYPNKEDFDKLDLMYALNIGEKKMREVLSRGRFKVHCSAILLNILMRLRDNNKFKFNCSRCGVIRNTSGVCINTTECDNRLAVSNEILAGSYLNIPDIKATNKDVFLLLHNMDNIHEFIDQLGETAYKPNLHEIFGANPELIEKATQLRTLV